MISNRAYIYLEILYVQSSLAHHEGSPDATRAVQLFFFLTAEITFVEIVIVDQLDSKRR